VYYRKVFRQEIASKKVGKPVSAAKITAIGVIFFLGAWTVLLVWRTGDLPETPAVVVDKAQEIGGARNTQAQPAAVDFLLEEDITVVEATSSGSDGSVGSVKSLGRSGGVSLNGLSIGMSPDDVRRVVGTGSTRTETNSLGSWEYWSYKTRYAPQNQIQKTARTPKKMIHPAMDLEFLDGSLRSIVETDNYRISTKIPSEKRPPHTNLTIGMTLVDVERMMGPPTKGRESIRKGGHIVYWSYDALFRTAPYTAQRTSVASSFRLRFQDGILVSIDTP